MIVLVVILCIVAVAAVVLTILAARRRLAAAELRAVAAAETAAAADQRAATAQEEATAAALAADERAAAAAKAADERAAAAEEQAAAAQRLAEERAVAAEQRAAEAAAVEAAAGAERRAAAQGRIDPQLLWAMERARSERTWRLSVALGPDSVSVFDEATDPLREALQVEMDAAREEVGTHAELDAVLPDGITATGSVLILRAAQELLAAVVRASEAVILVVRPVGCDIDVTVQTFDEDGQALPAPLLAIPASDDLEPIDGGVRIRNALPDALTADAPAADDA